MPRCKFCNDPVRFGVLVQVNPAAYDGEGAALIGPSPLSKVFHVCRPCARENHDDDEE